MRSLERTRSNRRPKKLEEEERVAEMERRAEYKDRILINGISCNARGEVGRILHIIKEKLGCKLEVINVWASDEGTIIKVKEMWQKIRLMRIKYKLRGTGILLKDLLTPREREITEWIEELAESQREEGKEMQIGYLKIQMRGMWLEWDEEEGDLTPQKERFQRRG